MNTEADNRYGEYVAEVSVNYSGLFPFIFFENLKTSLMIVLIGTVPLWFGSLFAAYLTFHGLVSTAKLLLPDVGGSNMLLSLLPHATFELPALIVSFLISAFWSRAVSVSIVNIFRKRPVISVLREGITSSVKTVLFVLLPLVLIAAAVEVLITPAVMKALL